MNLYKKIYKKRNTKKNPFCTPESCFDPRNPERIKETERPGLKLAIIAQVIEPDQGLFSNFLIPFSPERGHKNPAQIPKSRERGADHPDGARKLMEFRAERADSRLSPNPILSLCPIGTS